MSSLKQKIAVAGLWHLGEIYSAGLAELGHTVIGIDKDKKIIANFNRGVPPLAEPGLSELIQAKTSERKLSFTSDLASSKNCSAIFVTFDTPVDDRDQVNLKILWDFFKSATKYFTPGVLIVVSSQVPVGTCREFSKFIKKLRPELKFDLAYVPENLQLGKALQSFRNPVRVVVGGDDPKVFSRVQNIFSGLKANWLTMNLPSAELSKHALNAFLATSLSFSYDLADIAKAYGGDYVQVAKALRSDPRIGEPAYLDASIGFSGGTLARDLNILLAKAKASKLKLPVIAGVVTKNQNQRALAVRSLTKELDSLKNKKIAVFGLTYKAGTPTLRRALASEVIPLLAKAGAKIRAYDPMANAAEVKTVLKVPFFSDPYVCATGCSAIVIITNWPEFKVLDWNRLKTGLKSPFLFYDTRNFFSDLEPALKASGFKFLGVGR